jgi:hypothetical protein
MPEGIDAGFDGPLFRRAAAEGVLYVPGAPCFPRGLPTPSRAVPAREPGATRPGSEIGKKGAVPFSLGQKSGQAPTNTLRLSFGMPAADDIVRGIEALGRALREVLP